MAQQHTGRLVSAGVPTVLPTMQLVQCSNYQVSHEGISKGLFRHTILGRIGVMARPELAVVLQ
jgi:hypothetical protein